MLNRAGRGCAPLVLIGEDSTAEIVVECGGAAGQLNTTEGAVRIIVVPIVRAVVLEHPELQEGCCRAKVVCYHVVGQSKVCSGDSRAGEGTVGAVREGNSPGAEGTRSIYHYRDVR